MLAKAGPQHLNLTSTKHEPQRMESVMGRKVWLPALLYDSLPYFYLTAGFAAFFATLYISDWFWILPHYLLFSAACLHLAYVVYRHRHGAAHVNNSSEDTQADSSHE